MTLADTKALGSNSRVLARNTVLNFVSQVTVAVAALILLPFVVEGLGLSAYGLLSLALAMFSTFGILDLGLGRTTTKFVATYLAKGELHQLSAVVWTVTVIQVSIGISAALVLAVSADALVHYVLRVPPDLQADARIIVLILASVLPVTLASFSLRGTLEGAQRFDLVNLIKVGLNLATYVIPFLGVLAGWRVWVIVLAMALLRLSATIAYLFGCIYVLPVLGRYHRFASRALLLTLVSYASWTAVSSLVVPLLVQTNQYLIALLSSVENVTYYSVPYELLNGLWIIPGAIVAALFPVYSSLGSTEVPTMAAIYERPLRYIMIILGPAVVFAFVFAQDILMLWQGPVIASRSTLVLQVLVIGVFINSLEWVPASLLMGVGRPDLIAKSHLVQLPLYLVLATVLIRRWHYEGAAIAFTLRVVLEAALVFGAAAWLIPTTRRILIGRSFLIVVLWLSGQLVAFFTIRTLPLSIEWKLGLACVIITSFVGVAWLWVFDERDRKLFKSLRPRTRRMR